MSSASPPFALISDLLLLFFFNPRFLFIIFLHIDRILGNERKKKSKLTRAEDLPLPLPSSLFSPPQERKTPKKEKKLTLDSSFSCNIFWGARKTFFFFFLLFFLLHFSSKIAAGG